MRRVVIAGGGTAGWLTAHYLDRVINGVSPRIAVTLVESPRIGRIGVGEATIPTLRQTLKTLGIEENEFVRATNATFKQGIEFKNWAELGHEFFHPFEQNIGSNFERAGRSYLDSDGALPFADLLTSQRLLAKEGRAPRKVDDGSYGGLMSYAYHLDAEALADMLAERGSEHITHVLAAISGVERNEKGIAAIVLDGGQRIEGDLFIDCTGFRTLLLRELGPRVIDFSRVLLCDRAVAFRLPHAEPEVSLPPYTTATAMSAGWRWEITLQHRTGTGYVYCSAFQSQDDAERELREALRIDDTVEARHLRFKAQRMENAWIGNVVGIGLSGGFLEPLESTGIYLIEFAARLLAEHFPFADEAGPLPHRFNERLASIYDNIIPLLNLHYCLTQRTDTEFWRHVGSPECRFGMTNALLDLWAFKPPGVSDFTNTQQLFSSINYEYILHGMNWRPAGIPASTRTLPFPKAIEEELAHFREHLPQHDELVRSLVA